MSGDLPESNIISNKSACLNESLEKLEWFSLCEHIAQNALFDETKKHFEQLSPWISIEEAQKLLSQTQELTDLTVGKSTPNLRPFVVSDLFPKIKIKALLVGSELLNIMHLIENAWEIYKFFTHNEEYKKNKYPLLKNEFEYLNVPTELLKKLNLSIDAHGSILSSASPELKNARKNLDHQKINLNSRCENYLQNNTVKDSVQEALWTTRDGHIVLPVRIEKRGQIPGILRGVSSSGSTVFIEPQFLSNDIAQYAKAQSEVEIEEFKVLRQLSDACHEYFEALFDIKNRVCFYDTIYTRVKVASFLKAQKPEFNEKQNEVKFNFIGAKHPLFAFENHPCIANDLSLNQGNVWVLSGPNAGGKTVVMKTVGLLTLMAKAGFYIPVLSSHLNFVEDIFVDMGDGQDREHNLSTFSSHLTRINQILTYANENSLILLDELFVGTDPLIGMALARSTLEYFCAKKCTVIITTHYSNLKTLALEDHRFYNASMEFETQNLRPTYKILNGVPGQSFALELATRLNLPQQIIQSASGYVGSEKNRVDSLIAQLQQEHSLLLKQQEEQNQKIEELKLKSQKINEEYEKVSSIKESLFADFKEKVQKKLRSMEESLVLSNFEKQKIVNESQQSFSKELNEILPEKKQTFSFDTPKEAHFWKVGMRVKTSKIHEPGTILTAPDSKGMVQCQFGILKIKVHHTELLTLDEASKKSSLEKLKEKFKPNHQNQTHKNNSKNKLKNETNENIPFTLQTSSNTIDLRGLTVEQALDNLEHQMDKIFCKNIEHAVIIHGHGFGKIKHAVKDFLINCSYACSFRQGQSQEGGSGVTIVEFKL